MLLRATACDHAALQRGRAANGWPAQSLSSRAGNLIVLAAQWHAIRAVVPRLPREERQCQRCSLAAVDDEAHMLWECPALHDVRIQHIDLFQNGAARAEEFLQQDAAQLASFMHGCYRVCGAIEGWSAAHS